MLMRICWPIGKSPTQALIQVKRTGLLVMLMGGRSTIKARRLKNSDKPLESYPTFE